MSRDWQKDMELCKQTDGNSPWSRELLMAEQPDITIYWLQQYTAEKERADKECHIAKEWMDAYWSLHAKYKALEAREQKLREAIKWVKQMFESEWTYELGVGEVVDEIICRFESLYPKEEKI
ncbi:hypothetical protein [Paenibacillus sp. DMB20]|uniref:hypothetical protein n=1 Tax=Paenibacillus sp. DMB20 TaxID=1642570 RepID=UPI0006278299|nr:hypothetical protein [Paenibacillus sp. DMB20]KKO51124.1 hypothetical protein XI25_29500 [Paenibacillus sp. DMB20]